MKSAKSRSYRVFEAFTSINQSTVNPDNQKVQLGFREGDATDGAKLTVIRSFWMDGRVSDSDTHRIALGSLARYGWATTRLEALRLHQQNLRRQQDDLQKRLAGVKLMADHICQPTIMQSALKLDYPPTPADSNEALDFFRIAGQEFMKLQDAWFDGAGDTTDLDLMAEEMESIAGAQDLDVTIEQVQDNRGNLTLVFTANGKRYEMAVHNGHLSCDFVGRVPEQATR